MISKHACLILSTLMLAGGSSAATAQDGGEDAPRTIRLSYAVYGRGFHVLDVVVDLRLTRTGYSVRLNNQTAGFLSVMVRTNVTSNATGRFAPAGAQPGVRPVRFESAGYSRGAQRRTVLDYVDGDPVVRVLTPVEPTRDPVDPAQARGSIDTLSAMADMMHQVQQTGRCDGQALVFDGLRLSRVSSKTAGRQTVAPDGRSPYGGTALRCDFVSLEIGGFLHNEEEAATRKPQHGSAWVSSIIRDAPALPVRITFENPKLGLATMFLTKAEEHPGAPGG